MADSPAASTTPTKVRYFVLAWLCSLSLLTYVDRICMKEVGEKVIPDLGLNTLTEYERQGLDEVQHKKAMEQRGKDMMGWVFAAFFISYALFEVPTGWLGDRYGSRLVIARIVVWWSFFTALTGSAWDFWSLMAFRFLFGMGEAGAYPNSSKALKNWFPYQQRGFSQGLIWAFGRWGGAITPILVWTIRDTFGWRAVFWVLGTLGFLWVVFFTTWFRDKPEEMASVNEAERELIHEGKPSLTPPSLAWGQLLSSPTFWLLCGMYFCSNAGWHFFTTWDRTYYEKELKLDPQTIQLLTGMPILAGGFACMLGGLLTDFMVRLCGRRWGRTLQGVLAYGLGGFFFFASRWTDNPYLGIGLLALASFFKDFAMAVSWATCVDIGHRHSGTVAGFMNMIGNFGGAVTAKLVPFLAGTADATKMDWSVAIYWSGSMFLVAAACWLFIEPRRVVVYSRADHDRLHTENNL